MAWTSPKTWVNDEPLTAADLNAQLSGNIAFLSQLLNSYTLLRDEKATLSYGGTFTGGGWRTRALNTKYGDAQGNVTLGGNQFTLAPGTYYIHAQAPAAEVDQHKLNLHNMTDNVSMMVGSNAYASSTNAGQSTATLQAFFTITGTKTFELQHYCLTTCATYGFGQRAAWGTEIYAVVEIWRVK